MSSESTTIENAIQAGKEVRSRLGDLACRVRAVAVDLKKSVCLMLEHRREHAAETLRKAGKKATHLSQRYPLLIFATSLALGFLVGRSRR